MTRSRGTWTLLVSLLLISCSPTKSAAEGKDRAQIVLKGTEFIASAGDVNGDGRDDILAINSDRGWVIFGKPQPAVIDVSAMKAEGFQIEGTSGHYLRGSRLGDVNGDGLDDLVIGDAHQQVLGRGEPGVAYVIFGKADTDPIQLATIGSGLSEAGFRILGANDFDLAGEQVAGTGDVDGDGLADVVVAAPFASKVYVVFGHGNNTDVDLRDFDLGIQGAQGYGVSIPTPEGSGSLGLAGEGDYNGDGIGDLVIGVDPGSPSTGKVFVVFGKNDDFASVDVRSDGSWGFRVRSRRSTGYIGISVANAGDFNSDGLDDFVLQAASVAGPDSAFLIYGKGTVGHIDLGELGNRGMKIRGLQTSALFGQSFGQGRFNSDQYADLLIGAPGFSTSSEHIGATYVIYGSSSKAPIDVLQLGPRGYRITGGSDNLYLGYSVAGLDAIDSDRQSEIALGTLGEGEGPERGFIYLSSY